MGCLDEPTIRSFLEVALFGSTLICFAYSSTYNKLFGKLGFGHPIVYLVIGLSVSYLIWGIKRIRVPERFQNYVETILAVAIIFISFGLENLVPGKSDAWSIISYALGALTSAAASRKSQLGCETGIYAFSVSFFAEQLLETNWKLFPIVPPFIVATSYLRRRSPADRPIRDLTQEVVPLINATAPATDNHEDLDLERQYPPRMGQDSGESLLPPSNQQNNPEESSRAAHHSPSNNGGVSDESISEVVRDNQQNNNQEETHSSFPPRHRLPSNDGQSARPNGDHSQEVPLINGTASATDNHGDLDLELQDPPRVGQDSGESPSSTGNQENNPEESNEARRRHSPINYGQASEANISFPAESSYSSEQDHAPRQQDHAPPANYQNGHVHTHPLGLFRRRGRMSTPAIQNMTSSLGGGDTLSRLYPHHAPFLSFCFFFF